MNICVADVFQVQNMVGNVVNVVIKKWKSHHIVKIVTMIHVQNVDMVSLMKNVRPMCYYQNLQKRRKYEFLRK